ncbi:MAG: hypothetical protein ABSA93_24460 [Streptosporangiaceae bacterium]
MLPGRLTSRNAMSWSGAECDTHFPSRITCRTSHTPYGSRPALYPGTNATLDGTLPSRQCAAVMTMSPLGLFTTAAEQKCLPSPPCGPRENSAPTAPTPPNGWALGTVSAPAGAPETAARAVVVSSRPVQRRILLACMDPEYRLDNYE